MALRMRAERMGWGVAAAGVIGCVGLGQAHAAPIAVWDFETDLGGSAVAHVTASDLNLIDVATTTENRVFEIASSRGVAADGSTYTDGKPINNVTSSTVNVGSSAYARVWRSTTSPIRAFAFSLTVEDGYTLDLADVTFDLATGQGGIANLSVQYSTSSSFTSPVTLGGGSGFGTGAETSLGYSGGTLGILRPDANGRLSWNRYSNNVGLGGDEALSGTVYFRILGWGHNWNNNDARTNVHLDNLTISGQVIPEPASLVLLGLGGVVMAGRRYCGGAA